MMIPQGRSSRLPSFSCCRCRLTTRTATATLLLLLLLFVSWSSPPAMARPLREDPVQVSFGGALKMMMPKKNNGEPLEQEEDMLVIGAGFGRTGTTSFLTALSRIGLKSYHMSAVMKAGGHLDLWVRHIRALQQQEESGGGDGKGTTATVDAIIEGMRTSGYNATASMPACFVHRELMERYPGARVVLTVRGDGDGRAWAKSVLGSIGRVQKLTSRIPFRWIPKMQKMQVLVPWVFEQRGVRLKEDTGEFDADELAAAYNGWVEEVKASVPAERLLVFAAQDGWGPLCEFLSPVSPEIEADCRDILSSGEPYPRVNESAQMQRMFRGLSAVSTAFEYGPYCAFALLTAFLWFQRRRNKTGKTKKE